FLLSDGEQPSLSTVATEQVQQGTSVCRICGINFTTTSNLRRHEKEQHDGEEPMMCIDTKNGLYVTTNHSHGVRLPIHVQKCLPARLYDCEVDECRDFMSIAAQSGNPGKECYHLERTRKAHVYIPPPALNTESLNDTVKKGIMSTSRQEECMALYQRANADEADSVFPVFWGEHSLSDRYIFFSVYTGEKDNWCKFGRTISTFDTKSGITVYGKECPVCRILVCFQDYNSGFHNYNNRIFLSIPLCSFLTTGLSNHIAVGRMLHTIESHSATTVPHNSQLTKAFYHFSALRRYSYSYFCYRCGHHPSVVIADTNWKVAFELPVHLLKRPEKHNDTSQETEISVAARWENLEKEIIATGFCDDASSNPFRSTLSYSGFAPWMGQHTRRSETLPKTGIFKGLSQSDRASTSKERTNGKDIDEDQILHVLSYIHFTMQHSSIKFFS
ncbi:uncharacterized protein LOC127178630, partial [Labeo rohita]|uniref:uncharacterized protein LOC127178630 n=1 Tax=Labeo rohita TaxID=84645 RepID=UPI0021E27788